MYKIQTGKAPHPMLSKWQWHTAVYYAALNQEAGLAYAALNPRLRHA